MKNVYFILGEGGVGKSTLVRGLTGISQASRIPLRKTNGSDINLWAWVRSIQEDPAYMSPQDLLHEITRPEESPYEYYLIPLRITGINNCPDGQDYIDLLANHCTILGATVLIRDFTPHQLIIPQIQPLDIFDSKNIPPNAIANNVCNVWGWL